MIAAIGFYLAVIMIVLLVVRAVVAKRVEVGPILLIIVFIVCSIIILSGVHSRYDCGYSEYHSVSEMLSWGWPVGTPSLPQSRIDKANKWLREMKLENRIWIIGEFVPDEVELLEPIR